MKKANKFFSFIYFVIGVVAIVFSVLCLTADDYFYMGSYEMDRIYGGDAYTGMQNAAAQTANNIISVNENLETLFLGIQTCFGYALMVVGLLIVCFGLKGVIAKSEGKTVESTPTMVVKDTPVQAVGTMDAVEHD